MTINNISPSQLTLLDVTLRDGGYRNNFHFPQEFSNRLVKDLTESGLDFIEVGYRNGLAKHLPGLGPSGQCDNAYIEQLRMHCPQAKIGVMLHPHKVTAQDLHELKALGVSLIRICLTAPTMEENIEAINACKALGFTTTANIIKVSTRSLDNVRSFVSTLNRSEADCIYIADSFGNLLPDMVAAYLQAMREETDKKLGFHAHNNLSLALANTISAISHGAEFIDASICGMGFGTGNLAMEVLAGYFERIGEGGRLDTTKIFPLASYFSDLLPNSHLPLSSMDIFFGLNNLSSHFRKPIANIARQENLSPFLVSSLVAGQSDVKPNEADILELVRNSLVHTANY